MRQMDETTKQIVLLSLYIQSWMILTLYYKRLRGNCLWL